MSAPRGEFSSKFGFLMAAAGSAVGLGNIWGFPMQVASNGGAAFLLVYLAMAFSLAYPALMAELIIGRHTKANAVKALRYAFYVYPQHPEIPDRFRKFGLVPGPTLRTEPPKPELLHGPVRTVRRSF